MDKTLSVDQVWLIRKSESEEGFQRWHQDLTKLEGEKSIVKTIVVNIGEMMMHGEKTPLSTNIEAKNSSPEVPSPEVPSPEVEVINYDKGERDKMNRDSELLAVDEAWAYLEKHGDQKMKDRKSMCCRIYCDQCSPGGLFGTTVAAESLVHRYTKTQVWYDQGFVEGFIALVQHDVHMAPPPYKDGEKNIVLRFASTPSQLIDEDFCNDLGPGVTHIVTPVHIPGHFAVLYFDLQEATVTVLDGLRVDIRKWERHIIYTLKVCHLKPLDARPSSLTTTSSVKRDNRDIVTRVMNISFKSDSDPNKDWPKWTVTNDPSIRQVDGFNCGPIACLKVMEVFGILEPGTLSVIEESDSYRTVVMNYYQESISKYNNDIFLELRKFKLDRARVQESAEAQEFLELRKFKQDRPRVKESAKAQGSDEDEENYTSVARSSAMQKRNNQQAASAKKEIRRLDDAAVRNGATPDAVVTLKVDYRTHSHARGLIGIVFDVKPTGGIKVCCEHGIITHSGGPGVYWVPVDKYVVRAKAGDFCPLPEELYAVRDLVLDGKFNEATSPTIFYGKLHDIMIGATSPAKKAPGCKCKNGKCGKQCGCRRKGARCHSGCSCTGNCCE